MGRTTFITIMAAVLAIASCDIGGGSEPPKVKGIHFSESVKTLLVGDVVSIGIQVTPAEAKRSVKVAYTVSQPDIAELLESSSNDGVVIRGLKRGTAIVTGMANGLVDYCSITVGGNDDRLEPHIITPVSVLELPVLNRRTITVSLAGGTPVDSSGFIWANSNDAAATIECTGNVAVIDTIEPGNTVIRVRHPKARYPIDILVYVTGSGERPVYITGDTNVIMINESSGNYEFQVTLRGGMEFDNGGFVYELADGKDIVSLSGNGIYGNIAPKKAGTALIRVHHPKAAYPFEIQVIVNKELEYRYIDIDQTLVLLSGNESAVVQATFVGNAGNDAMDAYRYTLSNNDTAEIIRNGNIFFINALGSGKAILTISNDYADFAREVLIIVNDGSNRIIDAENYINTNQNVITMEAGGDTALLTMMLIGGNEADKNSFVWTVEDSTVIEAETAHGEVVYADRGRTAFEVPVQERFDGQAIISAKKVGISKIVIRHPKAKNENTVIVKVYAKGTFGATPAVLGGQPYYKVAKGSTVDIRLFVESGSQRDIGQLLWATDNTAIAGVNASSGLDGIVTGKTKGITTLRVWGGNLKQEFSSIIVVADSLNIDSQQFIYVLNQQVSMIVGQTLVFGILHENMSESDTANITCSNTNPAIMRVGKSGSNWMITALATGVGEIIIKGDDINEVRVEVSIEDEKINPQQPYRLQAPQGLIGVVKGKFADVNVQLVGAKTAHESRIIWSSDNSSIAAVTGGGTAARVSGVSTGQTVLKVSHPQSINSVQIVVYVVENEQVLENRVALYAEKQHYLITEGERIFLSVVTNAGDLDRALIQWSIDNIELAALEISSENTMAFITAQNSGTARITISHPRCILPLVIHISVVTHKHNIPYIGIPSIVETVLGTPVTINAVTEYLSESEQNGIIWSIDNSAIAGIAGNGSRCIVQPHKNGSAVITVRQDSIGFINNIVVYVYAGYEAMESAYIIGSEESHYRIGIGDSIDVALVFGAKGFPEHEVHNIRWNGSKNNVISVMGNGKRAAVTGLNEGIGIITVESSIALNSVVIEVEVLGRLTNQKQDMRHINVPSIVEAITGVRMIVSAATEYIAASEADQIVWSIADESIAEIEGNGRNCIMEPKASGSTILTVRQEVLGFAKNIVVYVYANNAEMQSSYIIGSEHSHYRIAVGDTVAIALVFGTAGFPEQAMNSINWIGSAHGLMAVSGSGRYAMVTGMSPGVGTITVESSIAKNRLTIEVEVVEQPVNDDAYRIKIGESDRIHIIAIGGFVDVTAYMYRGTSPVTVGLQQMVFSADNERSVTITAVGNTVRIVGAAAGQSYITVSHPNVPESVKLLVYVAATDGDMENAYPLFCEKHNYLLRVGESVRIGIQTINNDPASLNKISYTLENTSSYVTIGEISKKEIQVNALARGNQVIIVRYDGKTAERIFISVTDAADSDLGTFIITENIIGMAVGRTHETRVKTNLPFAIADSIQWSSENAGIATVESYAGEYAVIKAQRTGRTYITVRSGTIERKILVVVCATDSAVQSVRAANVEQRYYVINSGQNINVAIYSYNDNTALKQGNMDGKTEYYDFYTGSAANYGEVCGNIIEVTSTSNSIIRMKGKNEGVAAVRVVNTLYELDIVLYFEVHRSENGRYENTESFNYITADKTMYIVGMDEQNVELRVNVIGNFYEVGYFTWGGYDPSIISVTAAGSGALVNPLREGRTNITVSNPYCGNTLEMVVTVGSRYTVEEYKPIYYQFEKNVYEFLINDGVQFIKYAVMNGSNTQVSVSYSVYGNSVDVHHNSSGNMFIVNPKMTGITHVKYEGRIFDYVRGEYTDINMSGDVYFIVRNSPLAQTVYLTTSENFIIAAEKEVIAADIRLIGFNEVDSSNYKWSIDKPAVAYVAGNGNRGQIYAVAEGEAVITVTHYKAQFPLHINIRVTKNNSRKQAVYLTTTTNVIETVVGTSDYIYVQKSGGNESERRCTWTVDDPGVLTIVGSEMTGVFTVRKAGVVRITVTNSECIVPLQIVVIVKAASGSNRYIDTESRLMMMRPGAVNQRVTVQLVGGEERDNRQFTWAIHYQMPSDERIAMANGNVIGITGNAEQCIISAINEGVARIRITHEKADNPLYITVQVTRHNAIAFPVMQKYMTAESSEYVQINVPTYENFRERIIFTTDNAAVATVVGTSSAALITAVTPGNAVIKARIQGTDQEAELLVMVAAEESPEATRIVVGRTNYAMNPRSSPVRINAMLAGLNVIETANDRIWWKQSWTDGSESPVVSIFPAEAMNTANGGSREIQISPLREGEAIITIGHDYVHQNRHKVIYISVSESNNVLSLNKNIITMGKESTETLRATIIGGKNSDYDQIQWSASPRRLYDGTLREVVRIMGEGRQVMLYPMSDGQSTITAYYRGKIEQCTVTVESDTMFSISTQNIVMFPAQVVDIPFEIRPESSMITWLSSDYESTDPVARYNPIVSEGIIRITALREGLMALQGLANGIRLQMNIKVAYDYRVQATDFCRLVPVAGKSSELRYTVWPPMTRIVEVPSGISNMVHIDIHDPDPVTGEGKIVIAALEEIAQSEIKWRQVQPNGQTVRKDGQDVTARTVITAEFNPVENLIPFFVRNNGVWTNAKTISGAGSVHQVGPQNAYISRTFSDDQAPHRLGELIPFFGGVRRMDIGDGEEHFIVIDKLYPNSYMTIDNIEGITELQKDGVKMDIINAEYNGVNTKAIRVSGGEDTIIYDRMLMNGDLGVTVNTNYAQNPVAKTIYSYTSKWFDTISIDLISGYETERVELFDNTYVDTSIINERIHYYIYHYEDWDKILKYCNYLKENGQTNNAENILNDFDELYDNYTINNNRGILWDDYGIDYKEYSSFYVSENRISVPGMLDNNIIVTINPEYTVVLYKSIYEYSESAIAMYPELFKGVVWIDPGKPMAGKKISKAAVIRKYQKPVYESETIYIYDNKNNITGNFGSNQWVTKYIDSSSGQTVYGRGYNTFEFNDIVGARKYYYRIYHDGLKKYAQYAENDAIISRETSRYLQQGLKCSFTDYYVYNGYRETVLSRYSVSTGEWSNNFGLNNHVTKITGNSTNKTTLNFTMFGMKEFVPTGTINDRSYFSDYTDYIPYYGGNGYNSSFTGNFPNPRNYDQIYFRDYYICKYKDRTGYIVGMLAEEKYGSIVASNMSMWMSVNFTANSYNNIFPIERIHRVPLRVNSSLTTNDYYELWTGLGNSYSGILYYRDTIIASLPENERKGYDYFIIENLLPMPTINTSIVSNYNYRRIKVHYTLFNNKKGVMEFDIRYIKRECHRNYNGSSTESNNIGLYEPVGILDWHKLEAINTQKTRWKEK